MGVKESKIAFLPYEDALKRVTDGELERLRDAFKRHSGNANFLPKSSFFNEVLGELVPVKLSEQLFMTCGGTNKGVSFRDVIVLLALITKGTVEEKVKFLFCLMSVDGSTISREDLENFYNACDSGQILPRCVTEAFWMHDKLSYEDFYQWIVRNPGFSAVTRWLLEEQRELHGVKLSCEDDTPSFYHSLANITKLSEPDIVELEKRYWAMKALSKTGQFDLETFKLHVCPPLPETFCKSFFDFFDKNKDNHIDFKEMVCGISLCCRGLTSKRLIACFKMFDIDNDEYLSELEIKEMVTGLLKVCQQYEGCATGEKTAEELIREITSMFKEGMGLTEFRSWASTSPLIHEFLLLLSQICHIVFGLKPGLQEEEGLIVRRWLDREQTQGLQPGLLYYIVAMEWWESWKSYVSFETGTISPKETLPKPWFSDLQSELPSDTSSSISKEALLEINISSHSKSESNSQNSSLLKHNNQIHTELSNGVAVKNITLKLPGIIDNTALLGPADTRKLMVLTGEGGKLKQNVILMYGRDYEVLPEAVWKALYNWYGGNMALPRTVIVDDCIEKPKIELYPIQIQLYRHTQPPKSSGFSLNSLGINTFMAQIFGNTAVNNGGEPPNLVAPKRTLQYRASFSRKNTIKQIVVFLSQRLKIHIDDLRLWKIKRENELFLFDEEEKTVEEVGLTENDNVLIEVRNRDLSWPEEMNSLVATRNFRERSNTGLLEKGTTGLHNLGNTCFMNSAVQCLSNTRALTQYFSSKIYTYELNKTNPLGMKGILAKKYGDLMCDLWSGLYRSIAPVKLRWTIGRFAPRFNGFQQHDSQELLSFLLDGLHEDVNRVHDKPYVELNDSDGRPDREVAEEAWENHMKRNQSIIVDLFQGQLKSQVRCLHCGHCSVRFDPFIFLSLPIPMESSMHVEIPVFLLNGQAARRYGLLLSQHSTIKNLRKELSSLCSVPVERLLLTEVVGATIRSFLTDDQKLRTNLIGYIYGYEISSRIVYAPNPKTASQTDNGNTVPSTSSTQGNHTSRNNSNNNVPSTNSSTSNCSISSSNSTVLTNIGSSDEIHAQELTNTQQQPSTQHTKSKHKLSFKKPFHKKGEKTTSKLVEVVPKTDPVIVNMTGKTTSSNLVIPGTVNTSFSPSQASISTTSSTEYVCETAQHGLVVAMNRKMILSSTYFLSWQKFRPILFGIPMLLSCSSETTNRDIYGYIWKHVSKYVTGDNFDQENKRIYPYEVKAVDKEGAYCVWCPWYRFCRGCPIPCDDDCFAYTSSCLAVDWDPTVLHLQYQQSQEKNFIEDPSVAESYRMLREPISLDKCLKDFTKEEELGADETWYCSKCKEHRTIAKKFDIWKLPAILIIHLKRFQHVNNRWVKSNKLVKFTSKGFDPSMYLAKRTRTNTCEKRVPMNDESKTISRKVSVGISGTSAECIPVEESTNSVKGRNLGSFTLSINDDLVLSNHDDDVDDDVEPTCINVNETKMIEDEDEDEHLYNLYAISCHSGMLNGGHYITYAKNPNGRWYYYNDSSCKEVDPSIMENESPYMLFYEKKNLNVIDYMPTIKDKQPANVQQEEEEFEKDVKKYCSVM